MRITSHGSGKITVNGREYIGKFVSIVNGRVVIDGVVADAGPSTGVINIVVHGDCDTVENEAGSIEVHGTVKGNVNTGSGSIKCESVGGSVQAGSGDITCGNVGGSARSGSGDVFCLRSRASADHTPPDYLPNDPPGRVENRAGYPEKPLPRVPWFYEYWWAVVLIAVLIAWVAVMLWFRQPVASAPTELPNVER